LIRKEIKSAERRITTVSTINARKAFLLFSFLSCNRNGFSGPLGALSAFAMGKG